MKRTRFKAFFLPTVILILLLFLPLIVSAEIVYNEQYHVGASADGISNQNNGPPLPISVHSEAQGVYWEWTYYDDSYSSISSSPSNTIMDLHASAIGAPFGSSASAEFTGRYIATLPLFSFNYTYSLYAGYGGDSSVNIYLKLYDRTDGSYIYKDSPLFYEIMTSEVSSVENQTGSFSISIPVGHEIDFLWFSSANSGAKGDGTTYGQAYLTVSAPLSQTPVVPEPISSILFVTGGTLLAGRRFLRRKKKV